MKTGNLSRRLLAGAAGLAIGLGGAFAMAAPAQAVIDDNPTTIKYHDDCHGTTVKFWKERNGHHWQVLVDGVLFWGVDDEPPGSHDLSGWIDAGEKGEVFVPRDAGTIEVRWWRGSTSSWDLDKDPHVWQNPGWPNEGCESPKVIVIEDCDGNVIVKIWGNDTRRTWKVEDVKKFIDFGEKKVFEASDLDVVVKWKHQGKFKEADESYVTRKAAEDCPKEPENGDKEPENGEGGEKLPETGSQVALFAGGALLLLTLGGAMYVVARRRRISFTA